ncbi:2',3'-cyclic-nucleotide 2'-phosphodiesterase (5'-nucleotidase family) [Paenibacillus phyllosphaerae]|uniref:2',3'-cyclic-nucleotide 2'-phosphodiesterase (5'-nucleotidase family) n=1 Tax=Paenibacillus phyllosphaerae TaxID=274593 RepID=A0A7W5AU37_9BACL|nr:bifunctional UDP-sugar hydrolase/5'-nucleotidase [Paenibacillus phyllosphaerae]MBB3108301.1 2',3'-cyclic-nucleotide 2'-phosphodiesterase (5'-nucleotidase family) [Paenibacillus phyllosphaerae]
MNETNFDEPAVVLLHSNDIHSRLENAARMASYIADTRRQYGAEHVLLLDIGDHMDRMRLETEGSDGDVNIALMNAAGYEAVTVGNNEGLTFTMEQLANAYALEARFPVICANMKRSGASDLPEWMQPSIIVDKGGLKIGLIGATAAFSEFYTLLDWEVTEPLAAIRTEVERLRSQVDVIVIMSHLGILLDRKMAESIPGIDLILGGHTHHLLEEPEIIGQTYVCAAGKFGEYIGRVEIAVDPASGRPRYRVACVPVAAWELEQSAAEIIEQYHTLASERLSHVVAYLEQPLESRTSHESPLANLLAAGLRSWTDAQIGIVNAGQLLGSLAVGEVTAGQLHALCPSPINPCRMQLSGSAIRQALEESLLTEFKEKPIRGFGFRGLVLGTLAVDGLEIDFDPDAPPYEKITAIHVDGAELDLERNYIVGTIDMFTFGVGYLSIKSGTDIQYYLPEFIRGVLAEQLKDEALIADSGRSRWHSVRD